MPEDRDARHGGLVHGHDRRPKRRLFDLLKNRGLQANQDVTLLTDGAEKVRALTELFIPASERVLDRSDITMRVAGSVSMFAVWRAPRNANHEWTAA